MSEIQIERKADVSSIPDEELLKRAVKSARPHYSARSPLWVAVMDTFALGSTFAHQLCLRFDESPERVVKR